jgi:S-adenosylmethionine-diacylgycerolhomoserine-N-methlytransferase
MRSDPSSADTPADRQRMNAIYKYLRHIYDASRKYYLLGRDQLIKELDCQPGEHVIEVGCGTARNLIKLQSAYPQTHFYGLDASDEMLKTASKNLKSNNLSIPIRQGLAQEFDPETLFGIRAPDRVIFPYALSMIPQWRDSIDHALAMLAEGGEIAVVDFGGQEGLPGIFRWLLFKWLALFGVHYRPGLYDYFRQMDRKGKGRADIRPIYRGYAVIVRFVKA